VRLSGGGVRESDAEEPFGDGVHQNSYTRGDGVPRRFGAVGRLVAAKVGGCGIGQRKAFGGDVVARRGEDEGQRAVCWSDPCGPGDSGERNGAVPDWDELTIHADIASRKVETRGWIDARLIIRFEEGWSQYGEDTLEAGMIRVTALANDGNYTQARLVCASIDVADPTIHYCTGTVKALRYMDELTWQVGYDACADLEAYLRRAPNGFFAEESKATMRDMKRRGFTCADREQKKAARDKRTARYKKKTRHRKQIYTRRTQTPRARAMSFLRSAKHYQRKGNTKIALKYAGLAIAEDRTWGEAYCVHTIYSAPSYKANYAEKCLKLAPPTNTHRQAVSKITTAH